MEKHYFVLISLGIGVLDVLCFFDEVCSARGEVHILKATALQPRSEVGVKHQEEGVNPPIEGSKTQW